MALSHVDALERVKKTVDKLLDDPFLLDLPRDVTPDEVTSCLAVAEGRAVTVLLRTYDNQIIREFFSFLSSIVALKLFI